MTPHCWLAACLQGACPEDRLSHDTILHGHKDGHDTWGITEANEATLSLRADPAALARVLAPSFKQVSVHACTLP